MNKNKKDLNNQKKHTNLLSLLIENSESDKQNGFTILIDRRNDKWSSVKNVLILIQVKNAFFII
jgi:hypothetical protein